MSRSQAAPTVMQGEFVVPTHGRGVGGIIRAVADAAASSPVQTGIADGVTTHQCVATSP